jgi:hypothetical protein
VDENNLAHTSKANGQRPGRREHDAPVRINRNGDARERPEAGVCVGWMGAWGEAGGGRGVEASAVKPRYGQGGGCGTAMVAATTTGRLRSSVRVVPANPWSQDCQTPVLLST